MHDPNRTAFMERLGRIQSGEHRSAAAVRAQAENGLILDRLPGERRGFRLRLPLKPVAILAALFFGTKAALMAHFGPEAYMARLDAIEPAGLAEEWGASLMTPDPVTRLVHSRVAQVLELIESGRNG